MRHALWVALLAVVAVGCGGEKSAAPSSPTKPVASASQAPSDGARSKSGLYLSNDQARFSVNDSVEEALRLYERPTKAYDIRELPEPLANEKGLRAAGWAKGGDGYGLIVSNDKVIAAVATRAGRNRTDVDAAVSAYEELFSSVGSAPLEGNTAKYWFFEDGSHRLMICGAKTRKGDWTFTLALGEQWVMDRLRMDKTSALEDLKEAERRMAEE